MMSEGTTVWDHFERYPDNSKRAICKLCRNYYSYSTSHNLIKHLKQKHADDVEIKDIPLRKRNSRSKAVFKHFIDIDDFEKHARCMYCGNFYSFRSTSHNLRSHLANLHQINEDDGDGVEDKPQYLQVNEDTDLWEYFERTEDGAKCKICDVSIDHDDEALKAHIQTSHGALVVEQSDSETEKADDEFFTEVVYLDDEKPKRAPKGVSRVLTKAQTRKSFSRHPIKVERMDFRKSSLSSDEASSAQKIIDLTPAKRPRTTTAEADTTDELASFLVYIKSLLRTVPKESSTRLQMEIINLIMAEKFRQTAGQSTGSLDPEIVDVKSTSASSREMSEGNLTLQVYEA